MSLPTVAIHVELPAFSSSFDIQVPQNATVLEVKQIISSVCTGHPRPEGQRVIWRGRCLDDQERICEIWTREDDQRTVHLSVRPSAWTSDLPSVDVTTKPSSSSAAHTGKKTSSAESQSQSSSNHPVLDSNNNFAFIRFKHSQALCWLSNFKLMAPTPLEDVDVMRSAAKGALERLGYAWPDVLDAISPLAGPPSSDTLVYDIVTLDGKAYLSLQTPRGTPSPLQLHALNVLTYTFSILALPPSRPTPTLTVSAPDISSIPPHVNDLLRGLGLPPLPGAPNDNVNVQQEVPAAPAVAENAEGNAIREIPMRALFAPLLMVLFRTVLLLYFFSATRKPLLGLCLVAWIIYEIWTHVRIVILRPLDRADGNGLEAGGNGAQAADVAPVAPAAQDNNRGGDRNHRQAEGRAPNVEPTHDAQQAEGPPIPRQSSGIADGVALANIHNENKLIWPLQQTTTIPEPPTFVHKMASFLCLLVVTLHPEVYNRRRAALRQREGRLRTEMSAVERANEPREEGQELSEEEQRKDALRQQFRSQHARRAVWIQRYVERVRQDDWIEE